MNEALSQIGDEFLEILAPLVNAVGDEAELQALLAELGWTPNSVPRPLQTLADAGADLIDMIGTDPANLDVTQLLAKVAQLINAINAIAANPDSAFPGGIDVAAFKATIGRDLLDYVIVEYLLRNHQQIGGLLKLAGLIRLIQVPAVGLRQAYLKRQVEWNRIGALFTDPTQGFAEVFDWNNAPKLTDLLADLTSLLESYGLQLGYLDPSDGLLAFINQGAVGTVGQTLVTGFALDPALCAPAGISAGIQFVARPATTARGPAISILPYAQLNGAQDVLLSENISISLRGNADFSQGVAITLAPGRPPEIQTGFLSGGSIVVPGEALLGITIGPAADELEQVLLGSADTTRFAIKTLTLSVGANALDPSRLEALAELALQGGRIVIKPAEGDADSFLSTLLPDGGVDVSLSFGVRFSSLGGFQFTGAGGLEISVPTHVQLGPIDVQQLALTVKAVGAGLELDVGATISGSLGPLAAAVDGLGFKLVAEFPDPPRGNFGPVDVLFGFKPPNGVGLSLNAGVVQGGGYLYIDTDRGEYAGALELVVADWLGLHAIGLIATKLPDGTKGFSLLIIITADFGVGIELGFGFTLLAVGGLVGLNRTMLFQPLMDDVRTGAINSIMFPQDVVANAQRIISDLRAIFPPKEGTFLIGPMARIGWGTPTLVSVSLGVIIEIPPGDIAILGVLNLALPAEDDAILVLQVDFAGALEFDKKRLYFFASLYDSHILFITIQGEMGFLFTYGDNANLVLTVGGFYPRFNPPPLPFPTPTRVQLDIINESYARIRCDGYFAVTTNTAQFGSYAEYFFGFSSLSASGHSSFDALFQFSPFRFSVNIVTAFSVKVFGVGVYGLDIDLTLEGPTPWHARGKASISFLFFSIGIGIDFTWGDKRDTSLPPISVMPLLTSEFGKQANWRAFLPIGSNLLVSLRKLDASEAEFVLHPVGTLQISQRAVPLDLNLDKVGNQKPSDAKRFKVDVSSAGLVKTRDLQEEFAPGLFKNYDDAGKLSQPAYAPQDSGIELSAGGTGYASGTAITRNVRYDLTVIDTQFRRYLRRFFILTGSLFAHFLGGASVARSPLSAARMMQMQPFAERVVVSPETYAVARQTDNTAFSPDATAFASKASAHDYLQRAVSANPSLAGQLHVLPRFEVAL
jgi:hypothetical protein